VLGLITITLLLVYRNVRLWLIHLLSLAAAAGAIAATLKVLNTPINLLNVLAFPLILGVGVDYGTHLILAAREGNKTLAGTVKAVGLSGMTTITGFGALLFSSNPALYGLGLICSVGVAWCLVSSLLLVVPLTAIRRTRSQG
jgi:predicted RND superfamily exporter protein